MFKNRTNHRRQPGNAHNHVSTRDSRLFQNLLSHLINFVHSSMPQKGHSSWIYVPQQEKNCALSLFQRNFWHKYEQQWHWRLRIDLSRVWWRARSWSDVVNCRYCRDSFRLSSLKLANVVFLKYQESRKHDTFATTFLSQSSASFKNKLWYLLVTNAKGKDKHCNF